MKIWKSLQNPFLLVGQGFALGALMFFASQPEMSEARAASSQPQPSLLERLIPL